MVVSSHVSYLVRVADPTRGQSATSLRTDDLLYPATACGALPLPSRACCKCVSVVGRSRFTRRSGLSLRWDELCMKKEAARKNFRKFMKKTLC